MSKTQAGLGVLLLLTLLLPSASAHAVLQSADPQPNGHAAIGVTLLNLTFTEDVETDFTNADVVDTVSGGSWAAGPVQFDSSHHNVIHLPTKPLADGVYEVTWRALSVDTHTTRGSYLFAVGNATLAPGTGAPLVSQQDASDVIRDGFARFAFYTGLFLVLGIPIFALIVLRDPEPPRSLFTTATAFGIVGVAGAGVGLLLLSQRAELGFAVLDSVPGRSFLARGVFLLLATIMVSWAAVQRAQWRLASQLAICLGAIAVVMTSTGSHAAAVKTDTWLYVASDTIHLAMGAIWIGGIVSFLHVWRGRSLLEVAAMVERFSPIAIASVVVLLATGTIASLAHMPCASDLSRGIPCLADLRTENYVRLVAFKLALMAPLIALGAFHKYRVGPRLASGRWSAEVFKRALQIEAVVMVLILGAAGILASSAPPEQAAASAQYTPPTLVLENLTGDHHMIFQVSPNPVRVGVQDMVIDVHPLAKRINYTRSVLEYKVQPPGEPVPDIAQTPDMSAPGEWEVKDALFTHPGKWHVIVLLQLTFQDGTTSFSTTPFEVPVES